MRELRIDDRKVKDLASDDQGYLVLSYSEREGHGESPYGDMYTPSLMRFDRKLNLVWDVSLPETIMPEYKAIASAEGVCYMVGNHSDIVAKKCVGLLTKLDSEGRVLSTKEYATAGYNSTEISGLRTLPDGELLLLMDVYRTYGSAGTPCIARVDRMGRILWQKVLEPGMAYALVAQAMVLRDGGLLVACKVMPTREDLKNAKSVYSLTRLNLNTGHLEWTRRMPELNGLQQILEEPDGNLIGVCSREGELTRTAQIIRMRNDGTAPQVLYRGGEGDGLVDYLAKVDTDPKGVFTGVGYVDRNTHRFMKMQTDGRVLWEHEVKQAMLMDSDVRPSGTMMMAFQHRLVLVE
ncbi:MAG: hypothetical protein U0176_00390 [Bacteroidia bacterium]